MIDVNPEEAKGKMVRIAAGPNGEIHHVEPAGDPEDFHPGPHHDGPGPVPHGEHGPEHGEEIVGTVIGIDEENGLLRIMTKEGPVALEVTPDSELLLPNEAPESLVDIEPQEFEQEAKGKMVRIMVRDNQIDHIEPAGNPADAHPWPASLQNLDNLHTLALVHTTLQYLDNLHTLVLVHTTLQCQVNLLTLHLQCQGNPDYLNL